MSRQRVLFVCTGNSARSIMAEALLRHHAGDRFEVFSAGMEPKGVNPLSVRALDEVGVDASGLTSESTRDFLGKVRVHHAIIVCDKAQLSCPRIQPFATQTHYWPFPDPAAATGSGEERLQAFRDVRDQIDARIRAWLAEVPVTPTPHPPNPPRRMNKLAAEVIGTFALVFCGTGAIVIDTATHGGVSHVGVALTFGLVVMAMIYAVGDVSGAHLNPAVTLGFALARRFEWRGVPGYVAAQLAGAFAASGLLRVLFAGSGTLGETLPAGPVWQSFVLEAVLTFFLMLVILRVSTGPKEKGITAAIAVGGVVGLEAMFAGPICGASMNPARSLAPAIVGGQLGALWIYLIAPPLGAAVAVVCERWLLRDGKAV